MELVVKHYSELTVDELWEIYRIRSAVFVVEQDCVYQDIDIHDKSAYHLYFRDEEGIQAYARVLPAHATFDEVAIGRVISLKRRCGLGLQIVNHAIRIAQEKFQAECITIEAQVYTRTLYEKAGFVQTSEEFLEDGIPHIEMQWHLAGK